MDLTESLSQHRPALRLVPHEQLQDFVLARYRWMRWRHRLLEIESESPSLETLRVEAAAYPDQLAEIARHAEEPVAVRDALSASWSVCVDLALWKALVSVAPVSTESPLPAEWAGRLEEPWHLGEVSAEAWLKLQQGARTDLFRLVVDPTAGELEQALEAHLSALRPLLGSTTPRELIAERILPYLGEALVERKTLLAEEELARDAARKYAALLESPPIKAAPLAAAYVGTDRQRIGLCVLDKRGTITATAPIRPSGGWPARVERWLQDHKAKVVAIPESAMAATWLDELRAELQKGRARVHEVNVAGIVEARGIDDPVLRRVSPEEASAIVLARRTYRPMDEWCRIDPVRLALVPGQADQDQDRLREILQTTRERAIAATQPLSNVPVSTGGIRGRASQPLNPEIRGIRDLRPGLQLQGVITNVTKFGAFVNIGLRQEGLIHISELSDEFVNDPHEVVQTGQRVTTRVISVDLERGRIALSMRTEAAIARSGPPGLRRAPRARPDGPPRPGSGPGSAERNKALQDLENLFKK